MPYWYEELLRKKKKVQDIEKTTGELGEKLQLPWYERMFRELPISRFYWKTPTEKQQIEDFRRMKIYAEHMGYENPEEWARQMTMPPEIREQPSIRALMPGEQPASAPPYYLGREEYRFKPISPEQKTIDIGTMVAPIPLGEHLIGKGLQIAGGSLFGKNILGQVGRGLAREPLTETAEQFTKGAIRAGVESKAQQSINRRILNIFRPAQKTFRAAVEGVEPPKRLAPEEEAEAVARMKQAGAFTPEVPKKPAVKVKTGEPVDFTLYRGTIKYKPMYRMAEYGSGKYYYADMETEGVAEQLAKSYAAGKPAARMETAEFPEAIRRAGGKVTREFVHFDNPYVIGKGDGRWRTLAKIRDKAVQDAKDLGLTGAKFDKFVADSIPKYLKGRGFDGLVVKDTEGAFTVVPYVKTSITPRVEAKPVSPFESGLQQVRMVAQTPDEEVLLKEISQRLSKWKPLREETEAIFKEARGKQLTAGREAYDWALRAGMSRKEALKHAKSVMEGKYPKPKKPVEKVLTENEEELLYSIIDRELADLPTGARFTDRLHAREGLRKLLGANEIPTPSEEKLLEEAFGFNFVSSALQRKRTLGMKILSNIYQVANVPRVFKASWDLSAPFRQGMITTLSHPIEAVGAFRDMFKAVASEKDALFMDDLLHGRIGRLQAAGLSAEDALFWKEKAARRLKYFLFLHDLRGDVNLAGREEAFISGWLNKTFKIGKKEISPARFLGVRQSERAYATYLNKLRADVFDRIADGWEKSGKYVAKDGKFLQKLYDEDLTELSRFINRATGRGELWSGEYSSKAFRSAHPGALLNIGFFSPRLQTSRVLVFGSLFSGSKAVRAAARRDLGIWLSTTATILGLLAAHPDVSVEIDPRSAQFAKIHVGDTFIDIGASFQPLIRYTAQFFAGKKSQSGWVSEATPMETGGRFVWSKLAPIFTTIAAAVEGKTFTGEELGEGWSGLGASMLELLEPMISNTFREAYDEYGNIPGAIMATAPEAFGAGSTTYDTGDSAVQDHYSMMSQLEETVKQWKDARLAGDIAKMQDIEKDHPELQMQYDTSEHDYISSTLRTLRSYATDIYELNRQIHEIELNPNLEDSEIQTMTEELERRKQLISIQAILDVEGLYRKGWVDPGLLPPEWDELNRPAETPNLTPKPPRVRSNQYNP
jgi:hypothetical protein